MKTLFISMLISFSSFGWESLSGYPESIYVIQGYQIEKSGDFKRNIELAYSPTQELYGISFYNYKDMEDKSIIPSGTFNARACGLSASGVVDGIDLLMKASDKEIYKEIFSCDKTIFFRVFNENGEFSTYKVNPSVLTVRANRDD